MTKPTLLVEIVFLAPTDGGRHRPPVFLEPGVYRPHLVVQDRSVRHARKQGNVIEDDCLGVSFVEAPETVDVGEAETYVLRLDYFPEVNYHGLQEGATFTVREVAELWLMG
jgi:hypothetical protein